MMNETTGYIYLIGSRLFGWYKIGKSRKPEIRVNDLGVLLPFKIEVVGVWQAENYHQLELKLHEYYADARMNGEWFSFRPHRIKCFLEDFERIKQACIADRKARQALMGKCPTCGHRVKKDSTTEGVGGAESTLKSGNVLLQ